MDSPAEDGSTKRDSGRSSSRRRYRGFVEDYRRGRLRQLTDSGEAAAPEPSAAGRGTRRQYLREYVRWLRPHRVSVAVVFILALGGARRLSRLHVAGAAFLGVILLSSLVGVLRDYCQRLLNVRVMLSLRRALFERLLRLPLPALWEMKTGGILSRLTGDVDTTTGLMQMAIISPAISVVRLIIAIVILVTLNWRLALMMEDGRIAERGTHAELMARRGLYFDMVLRQETEART